MSEKIQLDLHTHSIISHDGGIALSEYEALLQDKNKYIAVTDHNEISLAKELKAELGEQVIVGEEIMTLEGEIIGLYLIEKIPSGLSPERTCEEIRRQGGLVYIPHPLETMRRGLPMEVLERIIPAIDIMEVFNARLRQPGLIEIVKKFAEKNKLAMAAGSDAHGIGGLGTAYCNLEQKPEKQTLVPLLRSAELIQQRAPLLSFLHPLRNKLKKKFNL